MPEIESITFTIPQVNLSMKDGLSGAIITGMVEIDHKAALGRRIKYLREEVLGVEQDDVARDLGVSRGAVGNWELGKGAKLENLQRMASRYHISFDWLATGAGEAPVKGDVAPGRVYVSLDEEVEGFSLADSAYSRENYEPKIAGALPEIDVGLGAGDGRIGEVLALPVNGETYSGHKIIDEWLLPESFIRSEARATQMSTIVMPVTGDSMLPNFNYGDRVLVDLSQNSFVHDAVYAISDGHSEPRIKRLQYIFNSSPKRVRIISDNPIYAPEEHLLAEVKIVGRVCGVIARR